MSVYLLILLLLVAFYFFRKNNFSFILLVFFIFIFLSAFRAETIGIDHIGYKRAFLYDLRFYTFSDQLFKWDIGWLILNYTIIYFYDDWILLLLVAAILTLYPMFFVFKRYTQDPLFSLLIYYLLYSFILSFSLIKQSVAIAFVVLALILLNERKNLKSLICGIIACTVHYSTLFFLPIVIVSKKIVVRNSYVVPLLLSTFIFGFFSSQSSFISNLISLLPFEKYANYSDYGADVSVNQLNAYLYILPKNVICVLFFYILKDSVFDLFKSVFFFNLLTANLFYTTIPLISRFVLYGFQLETILLIYSIHQFNGKNRTYAKVSVFFYALIYFTYNLATNRGGVIPYQIDLSIFN